MSGADWGSAFLLQDFKNKAGLNEASEYEDTELYERLSVAQRKVVARIAAIFPNALYQAPAALTRAVDGKTYSFGTDGNGNAVVPMGNVQLGATLAVFSGDPFKGYVVDRDFYDEGDHIRWVGNRAGPATIYGRWVPTPPDITALVAPILNPAMHRELISRQAVIDFAEEGAVLPSIANVQERAFARELPVVMMTYKKRYKDGGGMVEPARWYLYTQDLGSTE